MRNDCVFFSEIRVRFGEVDSQGIVYNANYTTYADVAFEEFFLSKGVPYYELIKDSVSEVCHRKNTVEFFSSAFYGNVLDVGIRVVKIGTKSLTLLFEMYRKGEDDILVTVESIYVGYDSKNRCSQPISDIMKKLLSE